MFKVSIAFAILVAIVTIIVVAKAVEQAPIVRILQHEGR